MTIYERKCISHLLYALSAVILAHMYTVNQEAIALITAAGFADLVGISRQAGHKALSVCHEGKPWRGAMLEVQIYKGQGGRSGLSYLVNPSSIPPEFIRNAPAAVAPETDIDNWAATEPQPATRKARHFIQQQADWKLSLIQKVIQHSNPRTPERKALVEQVAAESCYPYGKKRGKAVAGTTLYQWIKQYEQSGWSGLSRKARADARSQRVKLSMQLDEQLTGLGLSDMEQRQIAEKIKRRIASLWSNGSPSWPAVQMSAIPYVMKQLRKVGCQLPTEQLLPFCRLPRHFIDAERHYRAIAMKRMDAKLSADIQTPRITRNRGHLKPMEWVAGDVHHIDIAFRRDDGSLCTIKAVAWLDLATNRAFISLFLFPKGQMVRREHVIQSFVDMGSDPSWGVPTRLYLDRGGEYNWSEFIEDLFKLKHHVDIYDSDSLIGDIAAAGIQRSRAYCPQGKVIETLFASLEKYALSQLPGHMGGDRMKPKTQNQGKAPVPYPGGFDAFNGSFMTALDYYHNKPKSGHLSGQSPNERFRHFVDAGWQSVKLNPYELAVAFSKKAVRSIRAGGVFSWNGIQYRDDSLLTLAGTGKVLVRQPLFGDKQRLFVFSENERPLCTVDPAPVYVFGDMRGAGEQQRQQAEFNRQIRAMEAETDKLNLEAIMREAGEAHGPAPRAEARAVISISPEYREMAEMARNKPRATSQDAIAEKNRQAQLKQYEHIARLAKSSGGSS